MKYFKKVLLCCLLSSFSCLFGRLRLSSQESSINVSNSGDFLFNQTIRNFNGGINKIDGGKVRASTDTIFLTNGVLNNDMSKAYLTGGYSPSQKGQICELVKLNGTDSTKNFFRAMPGASIKNVQVCGTNNWLEGSLLFSGYPGIKLNDSKTKLNISLQNQLVKDIELNGGTIILQDNLSLKDTATLWNSGIVNFNNKTLCLPGTDCSWASTLLMLDAGDIQLHAKTELSGTWTFSTSNSSRFHAYLNGNGNILNLSNGGTIYVGCTTTLHLIDIHIKGLGSEQINQGTILLERNDETPNDSAELRLGNCKIALASTYTVTSGGWYVDGADTTILTDMHYLVFDQNGSLTVDGVTLWYDILDETINRNNIVPIIEDNIHLDFLNNGNIKHINGAPKYFSYDAYTLNETEICDSYWLGYNCKFKFMNTNSPNSEEKITFEGNGHSLTFPTQTNTSAFQVWGNKYIIIDSKTKVIFENIVFKNFTPSFFDIDSTSTLYFGNNVRIELGSNYDLNMSLTFLESSVFDGKNQVLDISPQNAKICIKPHGSVLFKNITIKGLSGTGIETNNKIYLIDNTSTVSFENVTWIQSGDYIFNIGKFNIINGTFKLQVGSGAIDNEAKFEYSSTVTSTIHANATMYLDRNMTFSYNCQWDDMFALENASSVLYLNLANIDVADTANYAGLKLTKGTMVIDNRCEFRGGTSNTRAIKIGNGIETDDLTLEVMAGGMLDIITGYLKFNNTS